MLFKTFNDVNISWLNKLNSHESKIGKSEKGSVQDDTSFEMNAFFLFVKTHNCRNATLYISELFLKMLMEMAIIEKQTLYFN